MINEIMPNPAVGDEWIELYNPSAISVDISGCSLKDDSGNSSILPVSGLVLLSGEYLVICRNEETINLLNLPDNTQFYVPDSWPAMNNDGDELYLSDFTGNQIDILVYDDQLSITKGKSIERINPDVSGAIRENAGVCVDESGHTAGRMNSLLPAQPASGVNIWVCPDPFNPFETRGTGNTTIYFTLPCNTARINIDIFNLRGNRIRRLASNINAGSTAPCVTWDGRADDGSFPPIGRYIVYLEAIDGIGGKVYKGRCTVVVADRI